MRVFVCLYRVIAKTYRDIKCTNGGGPSRSYEWYCMICIYIYT